MLERGVATLDRKPIHLECVKHIRWRLFMLRTCFHQPSGLIVCLTAVGLEVQFSINRQAGLLFGHLGFRVCHWREFSTVF